MKKKPEKLLKKQYFYWVVTLSASGRCMNIICLIMESLF